MKHLDEYFHSYRLNLNKKRPFSLVMNYQYLSCCQTSFNYQLFSILPNEIYFFFFFWRIPQKKKKRNLCKLIFGHRLKGMKRLPVYKKKSKHPLYNSTKLSSCRKDIIRRLSRSPSSRCFQGAKDERAVHTLYQSYFRVVRSAFYVKAFKTASEFQNSRNVCYSRHLRLHSVKKCC